MQRPFGIGGVSTSDMPSGAAVAAAAVSALLLPPSSSLASSSTSSSFHVSTSRPWTPPTAQSESVRTLEALRHAQEQRRAVAELAAGAATLQKTLVAKEEALKGKQLASNATVNAVAVLSKAELTESSSGESDDGTDDEREEHSVGPSMYVVYTITCQRVRLCPFSEVSMGNFLLFFAFAQPSHPC